MNQRVIVILIIACFMANISCSDNSSGPEDDGLGEASFTVSGEYEGEKTGIANFRAFEMSGIHTWDILIHDQSPMTYDISFTILSDEQIDRPGTGTYDLVLSNFNGTEFSGSFSDYREGMSNAPGYIVGISETSGTLTISSSSDDLIEGAFQFTASNPENGGTITVSGGEFSAVPRISPN